MRWNIPYYIAKYARPYPYFMKYAGKYYSTMKNFLKTRSNMNNLCWDIEKWEKTIRFKRSKEDVSHLLIDKDMPYDNEKLEKVEELFLQFNKEVTEFKKQDNMGLNYDNYKTFFGDLTKVEVLNTHVNWDAVYDKYKNLAKEITSNQKELANYAVEVCYRKYPKRRKTFVWCICDEGILSNLEKNRDMNISLPMKSSDGKYEYLGRKYDLKKLFNLEGE